MFNLEKKAIGFCEQHGIIEEDPRRDIVITALARRLSARSALWCVMRNRRNRNARSGRNTVRTPYVSALTNSTPRSNND